MPSVLMVFIRKTFSCFGSSRWSKLASVVSVATFFEIPTCMRASKVCCLVIIPAALGTRSPLRTRALMTGQVMRRQSGSGSIGKEGAGGGGGGDGKQESTSAVDSAAPSRRPFGDGGEGGGIGLSDGGGGRREEGLGLG